MCRASHRSAQILPGRFYSRAARGLLNDAIQAIKYCQSKWALTSSTPVGQEGEESCSPILRDTIAALEDDGILFVSASGNSGLNIDRTPASPAGYNLPLQITVGSTGIFGFTTSFSNIGVETVHLFAPGEDIVSTVPCFGFTCLETAAYSEQSGTSMSTPLVAGAAAVLMSAVPEASPAQIKQALMRRRRRRPNYSNVSRGKLNLVKALESPGRRASIDPD